MDARRQRGTGSVHYRQRDGRWCGQLSYNGPDGRRIRKTIYGDTRSAVERTLHDLHANLGLPTVTQRPRPRTTLDIARSLATHTKAQWIAKRDAVGCCIYCGSTGPLEKDHAIPIDRGGDDGIGNVVPACAPCNSSKGTSTAAEFVTYLSVLAR